MKKRMFLVFLIVVWVLTIFYFSSRTPVESSQQSNLVTKILKKIDSIIDFSNTKLFKNIELFMKKLWFRTQYVPAEMLVRKTAHFGLYFILGFLTYLLFQKYGIIISTIIGISLPNLIATIDEYTQQYYNRGSSLNDVIIDLSGTISGVLFGIVLVLIFKLFLKKK
ncbi:VanZ family protein [Thermosipho melanesiensis]|uniref:VanZ family protein n=1 Tax=Thermosipho melanesiensis TaxID=46541 RepID=UPI0003022B86|nr:VanZ family protein [Thermosipho melanesiensis]